MSSSDLDHVDREIDKLIEAAIELEYQELDDDDIRTAINGMVSDLIYDKQFDGWGMDEIKAMTILRAIGRLMNTNGA